MEDITPASFAFVKDDKVNVVCYRLRISADENQTKYRLLGLICIEIKVITEMIKLKSFRVYTLSKDTTSLSNLKYL